MSNSKYNIGDSSKKGLELLMRRLIDMRTLNVVTAAGDFDEIHNKVDINTKINNEKNNNTAGVLDDKIKAL